MLAGLEVAYYFSGNGGITWSDLTALNGYADSQDWYFANKLDDENTWLAASGLGVQFTDNFGASWSDKTGDLADVISGTPLLNAIKFVP